MPVQIPTFGEILTVSQGLGADSLAPGLWRGLVGAWPLQEPGGLTAFDVSGYRNNGTLTNMDPATDHVVTPMGRALDFDGNNDYVLCPTAKGAPTTGPVSLAAWIYCRSLADRRSILSINGGASAGYRIYVDVTTGDLVYLLLGVGGYTFSVADPIPPNTWTHVALVSTGNSRTATAYIHPLGSAGTSETKAIGNTAGTPTEIAIGTRYSASVAQNLNGQLVNPCVWNRALLPSEVLRLYTDPWEMHTLRRRVQVRGTEAGGATIRWPWQQRRHRRMAGVS